jgi:hypothetical protein
MPNYTFNVHVLARISSTGNPFAAILGRPDEANVLLFDIFPGQVYDDLLRKTLTPNPYPVTIDIPAAQPVAADFERAARTLFAAGAPLQGFDMTATAQTRSYWNGSYWITIPNPLMPNAQSYSYNLRNPATGMEIMHETNQIPDLTGVSRNYRLSFVITVQTA